MNSKIMTVDRMLQRNTETAEAICPDYSVLALGPQAVPPTRLVPGLQVASPKLLISSLHAIPDPEDTNGDKPGLGVDTSGLAPAFVHWSCVVLDGPWLAGFLQSCESSTPDTFQVEVNRIASW
jgi:hypothetical protein